MFISDFFIFFFFSVCNHILLSMLINNTHQSYVYDDDDGRRKKDEGFLCATVEMVLFWYLWKCTRNISTRTEASLHEIISRRVICLCRKNELCIKTNFFSSFFFCCSQEECKKIFMFYCGGRYVFDINSKDLWIYKARFRFILFSSQFCYLIIQWIPSQFDVLIRIVSMKIIS